MSASDKHFSLRYDVRALGGKKGEIMIYSVIDSWKLGEDDPAVTSSDFDKQLKALGEVDELNIRINSPGGVVSEAIAIRTMLMRHAAKKTVSIEGCCDSAATLIACMPDVRVRMAKGSEYMIHKCRCRAVGTDDDMLSMYNSLKQTNQDMADIYAEKSGKTAEECLELMRAETWYNVETAMENGFVDEILTGADSTPIVACAEIDEESMRVMRACYAHAPEHAIREAPTEEPPEGGEEPISTGNTAVAGAPAENKHTGVIDMELKNATAEMLRTENPALVQSIAEEARRAERERCQQIDELTPPGENWAQMAAAAKADGTSAADFFKQVIAAQRQQKADYLQARAHETSAAQNVGAGDSRDNDGDDIEAKISKAASDIADMAKDVTMDYINMA